MAFLYNISVMGVTMMGCQNPLHYASVDKMTHLFGVFFCSIDENSPDQVVRRACEYIE